MNLEQSPNWEKYEGVEGFIEEGFPFHEGFPRTPIGQRYELILRDGSRQPGTEVDLSAQYRAEGMRWRSPEGRINPIVVAAWRQIDPFL